MADRLAGQQERCHEHVRILRSILDAFESSLQDGIPTSDARGALLNMAGRLLIDAAVLDEIRLSRSAPLRP